MSLETGNLLGQPEVAGQAVPYFEVLLSSRRFQLIAETRSMSLSGLRGTRLVPWLSVFRCWGGLLRSFGITRSRRRRVCLQTPPARSTEYKPVDHWRHVGSLSCGRAQGCGGESVDDVCGDRRLRPKAYEGTSSAEERRYTHTSSIDSSEHAGDAALHLSPFQRLLADADVVEGLDPCARRRSQPC